MLPAIRALSLALALVFLASANAADEAPAATPPDAGEESFDVQSLRESMPAEVRQQMDDADAKLQQVFAGLKESAEPRDWVVATQLPFSPFAQNGPSAAERALLLRHAAAAAPEDAYVQWFAATAIPSGEAGCSAPVALPENFATLMRLESDNGLTWLPVLQQASGNKDELAIDATLSHMAAASRFDTHVFDNFAALVSAAQRFPNLLAEIPTDLPVPKLAPDDEQRLSAFVMSRIRSSPPLYVLDAVCDRRRQTTADPRRLTVCADIGRAMATHAATAELRYLGLELVEVSGNYTPEDRATERELAWLREAYADSEPAQSFTATVTRSREFQRSGDDIAAARKALVAAGKPATPPAGWQPRQRIEDADDADQSDEDAAAVRLEAGDAEPDTTD